VPHHEQTASSLPINRLQRGQRIARCVIRIPRKIRLYAFGMPRAASQQAFDDTLHYRYRILPKK
jgi:predicted lipase